MSSSPETGSEYPSPDHLSVADVGTTRSQVWNLYTSHFLSTWNARTYEFAAIIFTAAAYPDTLVAASIRGIVRTLALILFSSVVGRWVDNAPDRLKTLLSTISANRISVFCASTLWFFVVQPHNEDEPTYSSGYLGLSLDFWKGAVFALIIAMGILEGLSASGNMISMERDWVLAAASDDGLPYDLTNLNSSMRRIDLICKLVAPIVISVVISTTTIRIGVLVVGIMSPLSWVLECWCARRAWLRNPGLKALKIVEVPGSTSVVPPLALGSFISQVNQSLRGYSRDLQLYFSSPVWIPSLSLAFLHISSLAYNATFVTYLLTTGFSLDLITLARAAGSVVEISSTIVTPAGVRYLGNPKTHIRRPDSTGDGDESTAALLEASGGVEVKTEMGLERLGLWGISFQLINLLPVVFALWYLSPSTTTPPLSAFMPRIIEQLTPQSRLAFTLFFFLSISRLGLWVFDLTTQQLTQTMNVASKRSSFAGVEYSFISLFELGQHAMTIVLHQPDQFKWIALVSLLAVVTSTVAYAGWVWNMRGHLVHWEKIEEVCKCVEIRRLKIKRSR